jgi:hypothetical protein
MSMHSDSTSRYRRYVRRGWVVTRRSGQPEGADKLSADSKPEASGREKKSRQLKCQWKVFRATVASDPTYRGPAEHFLKKRGAEYPQDTFPEKRK